MADKMKKMKPKRANDAADSRSARFAWLVGAAGLCLILVAGIAIATGGRDRSAPSIRAQEGEAPAEGATPAATPETGTAPAASKSSIEDVEVPPLTIYRRRNPFAPLVNMQPVAPPGTTAPAAGTGGVSAITVPPELRNGSNPMPETTSYAVTLDSVRKQDNRSVARIRVGDEVFDNLAAGQTFAGYYKLLSIGNDSSATILFGDARFTIFTGQSIYP